MINFIFFFLYFKNIYDDFIIINIPNDSWHAYDNNGGDKFDETIKTIITQLKDKSFEAFRKTINSLDKSFTGSVIENVKSNMNNNNNNNVKRNSTQSFPSVESLHTGKVIYLWYVYINCS